MGTIGIVIPLHNKRAYVARAVESVMAQTHRDFVLTVVDDGSTDGSSDYVASLTDPRVRLIRISQRGPGAARNVGIEATPCEWVGLLDADDHWRPEFLARTAAVATECPDLVAVFTAAHALNATRASGSTFSGRIEDYHRARLQFKVAMSSSSILLKRAAFLDIGGFAEGYRYAEDTEAWFRLSCAGPTYYIDEQLCELEVSDPTSVTKVASSMERAAGLRKLADSFDRYLQSGRIPAGQIAS